MTNKQSFAIQRSYPAIRPGIRIHVGLPGAGKTFTMIAEAQAFTIAKVPVIIFDRNHEITSWYGPVETCDTKKFRAIRKLEPGMLYLVYDELQDTKINYIHATNLAKLYKQSLPESAKLAAGIAIPEAHLLLPKATGGNLKSGNLKILSVTTTWRHRKLGLWFDSQRIALLNTTAVEISRGPNAGGLRIFPMGGHNDLKLIKAMGGEYLMNLMERVNAGYHKGRKGVYIDCGLTPQSWFLAKMYPMQFYEEGK